MSTEVYFSTNEEILIFLYSCLLGFFLGVVYDALRIARATVVHNKLMVFAEDFFYMIFASLCYFIFVMELARGQIRLYILLGNLAGFIIEHFTVGNAVVFVVRRIMLFLRKWIFLPIGRVLFLPIVKGFREISTKIGAVFVQNCRRLKKSEKSRKKHLKVDNVVVYNENV